MPTGDGTGGDVMFEPDYANQGVIVMRSQVADAINAVLMGLPPDSTDAALALAQIAMALGLRPVRQPQTKVKVLR